MKHEGKMTTDGNGVVVLYSKIDEGNPLTSHVDYNTALIYKMGSVSPAIEQVILDKVRSAEGQGSVNVGDVLNKYALNPEHPISILQFLESQKKIHRVPTREVLLILNSQLSLGLDVLVRNQLKEKGVDVDEPLTTMGSVEPSVVQTVDIDDVSTITDINELEALLSVKEEEIRNIKARIAELNG